METSKEVALTICEKIQNEYPKRPLWQTMLEIEDLIDKHVAKQLIIADVSQQREQLISFFNWYKDDQKELSNNETIVDAYLKKINCG